MSDKCDKCDMGYLYKDARFALCGECMEKMNLYWDCDNYEFVDEYATCPDCGGMMPWCSCCNMYTQTCCIDWGTCACS
jgi:hypothetical protein